MVTGAMCAILCAAPAMAMDLSLSGAVEKIMNESQDLKKADANVKKPRLSCRRQIPIAG